MMLKILDDFSPLLQAACLLGVIYGVVELHRAGELISGIGVGFFCMATYLVLERIK